MKKLLIISILFAVLFFAWLFSRDYTISDENKPIKKITATTGLHVFGLKRLYTVWKYEKVYNPKGQLTAWFTFDGDRCTGKDAYEYNAANLLTKITSFRGKESVHPYKIETFLYDGLNRNTTVLLYEISKVHPDTFLYEKTSYYYDALNRKYKTTIEGFSTLYPDSEHTSTFIETFDSTDFVLSSMYISDNGDTSVTTHHYDTKKNLISSSGGLLDDSIVYTRNSNGRILKEETFHKGALFSTTAYAYDALGNKINTYSDLEDAGVYNYTYDSRNRLIKETRGGRFSFLFKGCVTYEYEFY